jgi:HEAT repeat protein
LNHYDSAWRATALANVGGHRLREFLPRVLDALSDPDWAPRRGALDALADLLAESGEWVVHAREQLQDPVPEVREAALNLLTSRHALTIADLNPLRYDPDYDVRCEAIRQLGRFSSPDAMPLLEPLLQDADSDIRAAAALSIVQTQHPDAAGLLATALGDTNIYVRSQVAFALGMMRPPAALAVATSALLHRRHVEDNTGVREWVDSALAEVLQFVVPQFTSLAVGDPSLLSHPEPLVRQAAVLQRVSPESICPLLTDPDLDVRCAALQAAARPVFRGKWEIDSQRRLFRLLDEPRAIIRSYAVTAILERCDSIPARALFEERAATESDPHVRLEMLRAIDAIDSQEEADI